MFSFLTKHFLAHILKVHNEKINTYIIKGKIMKKFGLLLAFLSVILFALPDDADARRFGGSRSFGGKSSFSSPAPKAPAGNVGGTSSTLRNGDNVAGAGAGAATAGTATAAGASRGFGGMGLFGGLLAGTLLGSMLMGTPFAGGGLFDIIIIGLLLYFGVRLFRGLSRPKNQPDYQQNQAQTQSRSAQSTWDNLRDNDASNQYNSSNAQEEASYANALNIDTAEFVEGAKTAYVRLQESWDKRDLDDIKIFTTKAVYDEIVSQAKEDPNPSKTEILTVNAQVNSMEKDADGERVSVYFTVLLREDAQGAAENVTEVWHFVRLDKNSMWLVDGIQQVN